MSSAPPLAPPSFWSDTLQKKVVFAKFHRAHHRIEFTVRPVQRRVEASVRSTIDFTLAEEGCPVIDLQLALQVLPLVHLDGGVVGYPEIESPRSPHRAPDTHYRVLNPPNGTVSRGRHQVELSYPLSGSQVELDTVVRGLRFKRGGVECFFGMSDRETDPDLPDPHDRPFLERYLPSNLEFDQHPTHIDVLVEGGELEHVVVANGHVTQPVSGSHWRVDYPAHYSSACPFFLLAPRQRLCDHAFGYASRSGSVLPVRVFGLDLPVQARAATLGDYATAVKAHLDLLEPLLGPFRHPQLLVYFWRPGGIGMEYAGAATVADSHGYGNLRHELIHAWVARSVMPSDGDAGWFDEGVATMIEGEMAGSNYVGPCPLFRSDFGGRSPYARRTDPRAWYTDEVYRVLYYLRGMLPGGTTRWCEFVRHLVALRMNESLSTREIQGELERWAGRSFVDEFDRYVYGR